jgi:TatD DNase family protein
MSITDTHTHLYANEFNGDRTEMINRAISSGVDRFFIPAIDSKSTKSMYDLEAQFPKNVFLMMGLHPCYVTANFQDELQHVEDELQKRKFFAVGEIGIDLFWDKTFLEQQKIAFKRQIQLAKKYKLPIVIHCRDAFDEIFEILESKKSDDLFGIFHCFTGNLQQAQRAISLNMMLGIGGVVTFKNGKIDQFLNQIPIQHIVLETDAPYLAPNPYRGKRNESAFIVHVVDKLAEIYGVSNHEIISQTTTNSKLIFKI